VNLTLLTHCLAIDQVERCDTMHPMTDQLAPRLPPEILSYCGETVEQLRFLGGTCRLELTRTQLILAL
jgi:hypothetical protein